MFSIAQLCFQFDNQMEGAFLKADIVTERSLVEEEKLIKGPVDQKIKMQVKNKNKIKVRERTSGSESASGDYPGALKIEFSQNHDQEMKEPKLNKKT